MSEYDEEFWGEGICQDCKFWGDERMKLWGNIVDHFRVCETMSAEGQKMFVSGNSTCGKWEKKEKNG